MTGTFSKPCCATCQKEKGILKCEGCEQTFCYNHVHEHRQQLNKQLEDIEIISDLVWNTLSEQTIDVQKHPLIGKINEWEFDSIEKIRKTAEDARQTVLKHIVGPIDEIKTKLIIISNQIQQSRQENDFFETDLLQWTETLSKFKEELTHKPMNITVEQDTVSLVNNIHVDALYKSDVSIQSHQSDRISTRPIRFLIPQLSIPHINHSLKWLQNGITVAGGNRSGNKDNQLYNPVNICIDDDNQRIYIADYWNNRIMEWQSNAITGEIIVDGSAQKNQIDQLNCPRDVVLDKMTDSLIICDARNRRVIQWPRHNGNKGKVIIQDIDCWGVAIDKYGYIYVSDYKKHEVKRWRLGNSDGTVVAGSNGSGNHRDQLNSPTYLFVDDDQSVYVSDRDNHRVMKWTKDAKEGILVAGNQTEGNSFEQLSYPTGIVVDQFGTVYVSDSNNHRIVCWPKDATQGHIVVGGRGHGEESYQLYNPWGLTFDRQKNLYVADNSNHRIQKFNIELNLNL